MVLSGISPGWTIGIALAASAALVALHFLRIQPRQHQVLTLLFWRQLSDRNSTPALFGRFRNLLTLLFLLLISSTICIALLGLRRDASGSPIIIVVDAGLSMSAPVSSGSTRLDEAKRVADQILTSVGSRPVTLIAADPIPRILVRSDDPFAIRSKSLLSLASAPQPASSYDALTLAQSLLGGASDGKIYWITDSRELPDGVEARQTIERCAVGKSLNNAAIVSSIYLPGTQDLLVRVGYWGDKNVDLTLRATSDAKVLAEQKQTLTPSATVDYRIHAAADGSAVQLELAGADALTGDDRATIALPKIIRPKFSFGENLPRPLRAALLAIGTASADSDAIRVVSGDAPVSKKTSIVIVRENAKSLSAGQPIRVINTNMFDVAPNFEQACIGNGPDLRDLPYDLEPLALAGDGVAAAITRGPQPRTLFLSSALFSTGSDVSLRAAFPIFLSQAAAELQGRKNSPITLPAIRTLTDPIWADQQSNIHESTTLLAGDRIHSDLTLPANSAVPTLPAATTSAPEPFEILLGMSLFLLVAEIFLTIRGKVV